MVGPAGLPQCDDEQCGEDHGDHPTDHHIVAGQADGGAEQDEQPTPQCHPAPTMWSAGEHERRRVGHVARP